MLFYSRVPFLSGKLRGGGVWRLLPLGTTPWEKGKFFLNRTCVILWILCTCLARYMRGCDVLGDEISAWIMYNFLPMSRMFNWYILNVFGHGHAQVVHPSLAVPKLIQ